MRNSTLTRGRLARSGLLAYRRHYLAVGAGLVVCAMVLTGSLLVGDSVQASLERIAALRLGAITHTVEGGERMFRAALADAMPEPAAPVLWMPGSVALPGGQRINGVQVVGIDERFWDCAGGDGLAGGEGVWINPVLADALQVGEDSVVIVRVRKPSALPSDAPLSQDLDQGASLRLTVNGIVGDEAMGRFSLRAEQVTPPTVFVPLARLQDAVDQPGRANLVVCSGESDTESLMGTLRAGWDCADAEVEVRALEGPARVEVRSRRVFLDAPVAAAALALTGAQPVLTYFVNWVSAGERSTPYSMVTAIPESLAADEMLLHPWLAEDLDAGVGDAVSLTYFVMGPMRSLIETQAAFRVKAVLEADDPLLDPTLMPDFPGLSEAESCRDWDPGFPLDLDSLRDKDEAYWDNHRGTPKAFIALATGQAMWSNRFGATTAVRMPGTVGAVQAALSEGIDPLALGVTVVPVRELADRATGEAMQFGELFVSFSVFLVGAALMLSGLLLVFLVEQRSVEVGTLLALGFHPRAVRRLLMREVGWVVILASAVGAGLGLGYTRLLLQGLSRLWSGAIGGTPLVFAVSAPSVIGGWLMSVVVALLALAFSLRRTVKRPVNALLRGEVQGMMSPVNGVKMRGAAIGSLGALAAGGGIAFRSAGGGPEAAPGFFQAGSLVLIAGLAAAYAGVSWLGSRPGGGVPSRRLLSLGNLARRRGRSLAALAMLAAGCFLIIAVSSFHLDPRRDLSAPAGGTGGFTWWAQLDQPFTRDPNDAEAQEAYGMDPAVFSGHDIVPMRVRAGDEASCLNLNRAQQPRLLGVDPLRLAGRFTFAGGEGDEPGWAMLAEEREDQAIPAVADLNAIRWALGKTLGDTLTYTGERGETFEVRLVGGLANSMLQGSIVIDEAAFVARYPSASGYGWLLVDSPPEQADAIAEELRFGLADAGIELTRTADRMAALDGVQNTYLAIFQALGALGVLLGSAGLGVVVLRNVLERRRELGLLRAVGFTRAGVFRLVLVEHGALLVGGVVIGVLAALIAVAPQDPSPGSAGVVTVWLAAVAVNGLFWVILATRVAIRGSLLGALREE